MGGFRKYEEGRNYRIVANLCVSERWVMALADVEEARFASQKIQEKRIIPTACHHRVGRS